MPFAFIIGCARSGTSILGELLSVHKDVHYIFEAHALWEVAPPHADGSHRLDATDASGPVKNAIGQTLSQEHARAGRRYLIEKCPRNVLRVPYLRALFPEAGIVHIVRDGRDVACSLRPGLSEGWNHLKPPNWQHLATLPLIERCAAAWRDVMAIALDDLAGVPHLEVRYEELVTSPAGVSSALREYLDLPPSPEMDAFEQHIQDKTENSYHARIQNHWYRPDHRRRIGRWRENLTAEEQKTVHDIQEPILRKLGYL